jgi:hypothetical protein
MPTHQKGNQNHILSNLRYLMRDLVNRSSDSAKNTNKSSRYFNVLGKRSLNNLCNDEDSSRTTTVLAQTESQLHYASKHRSKPLSTNNKSIIKHPSNEIGPLIFNDDSNIAENEKWKHKLHEHRMELVSCIETSFYPFKSNLILVSSSQIRMKMEFIYQTLSLKAMQLIHQAPTITVIQPDHRVWI